MRRQPEHRENGKLNLFPELPPGLSILYRFAQKTNEHAITFRLYAGHYDRYTMHFNRDNWQEKYEEAVNRLIELSVLSRKLADQYTMVPWETVLERLQLEEKQLIRYVLQRKPYYLNPGLNNKP